MNPKENLDRLYVRGKILFLAFFLLLVPGVTEGQYAGRVSADHYLDQTMEALYSFDLEQANALSSEMLVRFPGHYLSHFTRSQYLWWMIITHPFDQRLEEAYNQNLIRSLTAIKPLIAEGRSHSNTFYFINIYAMQARLFLKKKEYLRTILSLKSCIDQIEVALGNEESYPPFFLSSGMYNYMSEYARDKFPFLSLYTLLYPRGDKVLGLKQLEMASQSGHFIWRTEARYLLMKIFLELEQKPGEALPLVRELLEQYPDHLIFRMHYVKILEALGEMTMAASEREALLGKTRQFNGISEVQRAHLLEVFRQ
jgi:tetratricopeptide (TPR) repeat protein